MPLSGIGYYHVIAHAGKVKLYPAITYISRKIELDSPSDRARHLIHKTRRLIPEYIFRKLTHTGVVTYGYGSVIEKLIDDSTKQHFKRSGRAYACRGYHGG